MFVQLTGTSSPPPTFTDPNGNYAFSGLEAGGTYTVTPFNAGVTFNPASRTYQNLSVDQTAADFTIVPPASPSPTPTATPPLCAAPCRDLDEVCLDTTFSSDGKAFTLGGDVVSAAVLQPDGKVIVAGYNYQTSPNLVDFAVSRFNSDGSLDTTFGTAGTVSINFLEEQSGQQVLRSGDYAYAIVLQPDNKIVVGGSVVASVAAANNRDFALARLNANGSLDITFGVGGADGDGKVLTNFEGTSYDAISGLAIQADGKIVAGGTSGSTGATSDLAQDFALARYNPDGTLDSTFGVGGTDGNGKLRTDFLTRRDGAQSVVVQPDGKIIAGGYTQTGATDADYDFALVRYNAAGTLDTTFDGDGKVTTNFGGADSANDIILQPDNRIIAVGRFATEIVDSASGDIAVARYLANGSLDSSFDTDGKVTTDFSNNDYAKSVAIQPDGRIVVGGRTVSCSSTDMALVRYEPTGALDTSFGTVGLVTVKHTNANGTGRIDGVADVLIQSNGKIVAAGNSDLGTNISGDFLGMVVRYVDGACTAPTPAPTPTAAPTPLLGEVIAYQRFNSATNYDIYVVRPNGTGQTRLLSTAGADIEPNVSPLRTRIAFNARRDGNQEIYSMAPDGTDQTRLTNNTSSDRQPSVSGDGQRIVFTSSRDGNDEIYAMNADGSGQVNLTNLAGPDSDPAISPDGTRIAFISRRDGPTELYVMNANGSGVTRLTNNGQFDGESSPDFSPDGQRIVFSGTRNGAGAAIYVINANGGNETQIYAGGAQTPTFSPDGTRVAFLAFRTGDTISNIYAVNLDGSNLVRVSDDTGLVAEPDWGILEAVGPVPSPTPPPPVTGQKLAFSSDRDGNYEVYVMRPDGTGQTRLTRTEVGVTDKQPSIAPSIDRIAFASDRDGNFEIYTMNAADGTNVSRLTTSPDVDDEPSLSADGTRVAFRSRRSGGSEIYVMNTDGTNLIRLTNNNVHDGEPSISADGSRVAFVSVRDGDADIYVVNADGSNLMQVTNHPAFDHAPALSPDGTRVVFTSFRAGSPEIFISNIDGSNLANLTDNSACDIHPTFAPDGQRVAFASNRDGGFEIYTANADGSGTAQLTNNQSIDSEPSWGGGASTTPTPTPGTASISGVVTYATTPATQAAKFVPGVLLSAAGSPPASSTTNASGAYTLSGLGSGPYTVTPSKSGDVNGSISGLDAARVAQHVAGLITLTPNQQVAGDATNNGSLSGLDAARIAQHAAGLSNPGIAGQWKFLPTTRQYTSVNAPLANQNYDAILVGDVTGNWNASTLAPRATETVHVASEHAASIGETDLQSASINSGGSPTIVGVTLPAKIVSAGSRLTIPISIGDTSDKGIVAYEFTLLFDPTALTPSDALVETANTLSNGWSVVFNDRHPGSLRVIAFGTIALDGRGTLLRLRFTTRKAVGRNAGIRLVALQLNEIQ
jgi:uncharacterized delta-60 repeat protein